MSLYFVSYDLRNARNYQALYDELNRFSAVRILESTWCFNRFNTDVAGLRDHFLNFVDRDDGIIVSEIHNWASYGTNGNPNQLP